MEECSRLRKESKYEEADKILSQLKKDPSINQVDVAFEDSIISWYLGRKGDAIEAADRVLFDRKSPKHLRAAVNRNTLFYLNQLPYNRKHKLSLDLGAIRTGCYWQFMNPSIVRHGKGYIVNLRAVNYIQKGHSYKSMHHDGIIRTRNFIITLSPDLTVEAGTEMIDQLPYQRYPKMVTGMEDVRLVSDQRNLYLTCTTFENHPREYPQISAGFFNLETSTLEKLDHCVKYDSNHCEKNWLPFLDQGKLAVIYKFDPFEVGYLDRIYIPKLQVKPPIDLSSFRGSAGPIPFEDGFLSLVHEVYNGEEARTYWHRFVSLSKGFGVKRISRPFYFLEIGIEFCCGMCYKVDGTGLILSIGIKDKEAYLIEVPLEKVELLLTNGEVCPGSPSE